MSAPKPWLIRGCPDYLATVDDKLEMAFCIVDAADRAATELANGMPTNAETNGLQWVMSYALGYAGRLIREAQAQLSGAAPEAKA